MAKKSKDGGTGSAERDKLLARVEKLQAKLEKARGKADRWKAEARSQRSHSAKLEARLRRLLKERPVDHEPAGRGDVPVETSVVADGPDASWTVVRLRDLAREQGVVGASRMTKAQLLQAVD